MLDDSPRLPQTHGDGRQVRRVGVLVFGAEDDPVTERRMDGLRDLQASDMTMVVVSHEMRFVREAAHRVVFMEDGFVCDEGPPAAALVLIVYFGLPNVGILLPSYWVLWLVLSLLLAAFARCGHARDAAIHRGCAARRKPLSA
jgi:hypothetical protein